MRNRIAEVLLFLSWPVCIVHRVFNSDPIRSASWIKYDPSVLQDFRWYWVYNELWMSAVFVLIAALLMKTKTLFIRILIRALLIVSVIDIVNYWLWFRRNEVAIGMEGLVMVFATGLIIYNKWNKKK